MGAGRLLFHAGLRVRVVCCTHLSLFGTEPWRFSTFSSCSALSRRLFFLYLLLRLPSSEVPCFRRFFCSCSCCWCCCCFRCFFHCCICFPFFCSMSQVSVLEGRSWSTICQGRLRPFPLLSFFISFFCLLFSSFNDYRVTVSIWL